MKRLPLVLSASAMSLSLVACTSHLVFMEESQAGLKIRAGGAAPSPYEISLGYRRGMVAAVPKQLPSGRKNGGGAADNGGHGSSRAAVSADGSGDGSQSAGAVNGGSSEKTVVLDYDPNELMSLYTEFCANVGFNDPVEFYHLLVTGDAAVRLLAVDNSGIRDALGRVRMCERRVESKQADSKPVVSGTGQDQNSTPAEE